MKNIIFGVLLLCSSFAFSQTIVWGPATDIATSTFSNLHPRVAVDRAGNAMVIWGKATGESVYFSRSNGTTFSAPVKLNPSWMTVATASWMGPDIASKGDTVYVAVKRTPEASDTNHVYSFASYNAGVSFQAPIRVDYIMDSISRFPTLAVDSLGNPIVGFMKFNSSFLDSRWAVTRSSDFGMTYSTDTKASGWSGGEVCDCCPGALVSSGNTTAMLYRDNLSNVRDIWAGISNNNSSSFDNGFSVDNSNWMIMTCPSTGPDGIIHGDSIYSVYMSGAAATRVFLSKTSLSTGGLSSTTGLAASTPGLTQQNYPRIAGVDAAAAIVWRQTVSGVAQLGMLFTDDIESGFQSSSIVVDTNNVTNVDVAMATGKVHVVWQDDMSGTVKYRMGTYPVAPPSAVKQVRTPTFAIYPNPASESITLGSVDFNYTVSIHNFLGEVVHLSTHFGETSISIMDLSAGIYSVSILSNNSLFTLKFVKV